jgi:hypothetical protein
MQLEMRSISKRVEQTHLDLQECLKVHHLDSSDDDGRTGKYFGPDGGLLYTSGDRLDIQITSFFLSFPTMPILSQSDI